MNGSDQDSDFQYVSNQKDIVEHARKCYTNYPTIVNNIPKESNKYKNTMDDYALIDNNLARSQTDIGESSNLAQIAQTYECSFSDKKYSDYVCILSVLAQASIDSAKRRFDVDISAEIKRIKKDMDIAVYKYPLFWKTIKRDFNANNLNKDLICPMNYLSNLEFKEHKLQNTTLSMSDFFIKHPLKIDRRICKRVEELITKYSLQLYMQNSKQDETEDKNNQFLLLRSDFEKLVNDIRSVNISGNYMDLMSWLIDRAFMITPAMYQNNKMLKTNLNKNKSLLLKVLYEVNPKCFLQCFVQKV